MRGDETEFVRLSYMDSNMRVKKIIRLSYFHPNMRVTQNGVCPPGCLKRQYEG